MAADGEFFTIGSTVSCTTCFDQNIEGEVLAFDQNTKMLILKCPSTNSVKLCDVHIVNLSHCSEVQVKQEVSTKPDQLQSLNLQMLTSRVRNAVDRKKRLIAALAAGVSPEGQKLYMAISKTINEVTWAGPNIVVFKDVTITPPYKVENVSGSSRQQLSYVQKIVEKFTKDQLALQNANSGNQQSTNSAPTATGTTTTSSSSSSSANQSSSSPVSAN